MSTPAGPSADRAFDENREFNDHLDAVGTFRFEGYDYAPAPSEVLYDYDPGAYVDMLNQWKTERREELIGIARGVLDARRTNAERFSELAARATTGAVIPFVGAGLSMPCGNPGWKQYLFQLAEEGYASVDEIQALVEEAKYEEAAELVLESMGENGFSAHVRGRFTTGVTLRGAVQLLPGLAPDAVLTTNFDHVIELVFQEAERQKIETVIGTQHRGLMQDLAHRKRILVKLHGDAHDPHSRVLTLTEYQRAYGETAFVFLRPLPDAIRLIFLTRCLLFLGCSLDNDRTMQLFKYLADEQNGQDPPSHYAILEQPDDPAVLRARERFLSERHILPIWYPNPDDDHRAVEGLLTLLAEIRSGRETL